MSPAELRRLPSWPASVAVVLAGLLALALRAVSLVAALGADGVQRLADHAAGLDEALTRRWGVAPAGGSLVVLDVPFQSPWQSRADR